MSAIWDVLSSGLSIIKLITPIDILDILILSYLVYKAIKMVRETRALQLVRGILLICIAYFLITLLHLKAMEFLLQNFFQWGIVAVVVMFQPELRRALEKMGRTKVSTLGVFNNDSPDDLIHRWQLAIDAIAAASTELSASSTGALMVIERQTRLGEQIDTGTVLEAVPTPQLLGNIFFPNTPLHDGAVIIRDGMILAAACYLPKPLKEELVSKQLGTRHRAAIGMSELSDAIIVVVSEETGVISVAENGELTRGFTEDSLKKHLTQALIPDKQADGKEKKRGFWRIGK